MLKGRWISALALVAAGVLGSTHRASAQNVTTGSISGTVTDETGAPVDGAQVTVTNTQTGVAVRGTTRDGGRYIISGLEVGGPYTVGSRRLGFAPVDKTGFRVTLSQTTRDDIQMSKQATVLTSVRVSAAVVNTVISPSKTGTTTTISDSALRRLPTVNRNFTDFVSSVPQVSMSTGSLSGGGVNVRQNAIQIDGASAGDLFGIGSTGQPGASANARSIPLDAVKEYQALLAPFDVREGNFGGLLINAVTKSGTNDFHGSAYGYERGQNLTRTQSYLNSFYQRNYGFTLGGPILKNHVFFFINPELQRFHTPITGPYIGSPDIEVSQASIDRFRTILQGYGLAQPGDGSQVLQQNPNTNVFARIDAYLPFGTRLVLRENYADAQTTVFSRGVSSGTSPRFPLTSYAYNLANITHSGVAEFLSNFSNGTFNELILNQTKTYDARASGVSFPSITVRGVPRSDGGSGTATLVAGTEASSQGNTLAQNTFEFTDNLTIPIGAHHVTLGTKVQYYHPNNFFGQSSLGSWSFSSLDSLANGIPSADTVSAFLPSDPNKGRVIFHARQYGAYAQDVWQVTDGLSLTGGVRVDIPKFDDTPPVNPVVLAAFNRSTASVPSRRLISPRFAFNWDVTGDQRNQLRGGVGDFAGPPPFVYLSNAFQNSGLSGYATLTCNGSTNATTSFVAPPFNTQNIANPPTTCLASGAKPGATLAAASTINTIDPNFKFPQYRKVSLGYDHQFSNGLISTVEGLYTRALANVFYQNLALAGPQSVDAHGRVLYGTFTATGASTATINPSISQVYDLTNEHGDYTYSLTGTLQKSFTTNFEGSLSYTYSQARDVTTTTSSTANSNYRLQRSTSGNLLDQNLSRSKNDQPHRIIASGTYAFRTKTDLSFIYQGNSGAPYDYVVNNGDANADGQSGNDLIYVPTDVHNPSQILFAGYNDPTKAGTVAAQQAAFDSFINSVPCLRKNRGKILGRNACTSPWQNDVDVAIAQSLEAFHQQNLQLRLDIANFGNLLNPHWGRQQFVSTLAGPLGSSVPLLTQSGNVVGPVTNGVNTSQGIYTFDTTTRRFSALNAQSNYRMQLSLRYSF